MLRASITTALNAFNSAPLRQASLDLLATLGYRSDKTVALEGSKPKAFLQLLRDNNPGLAFDEKKALFADWKSADLLFQLTDDDLSGQKSLFNETTIQPGLLRYLTSSLPLPLSSLILPRPKNRTRPNPIDATAFISNDECMNDLNFD